MGQIFIAATYGGIEVGDREPDSALSSPSEAPEMLLLRDLIVPELRSRGFAVVAVPDCDRVQQTIDWIDRRAQPGDVAFGIHADAYSQAQIHGASVFYISKNGERKSHAQMMLAAFSGRLASIPNLGVKPDSATALGSLAFCRRIAIPSLMMELGLRLAPDDRLAQQQELREVAAGIADGLAAWNRDLAGSDRSTTAYLPIDLKLNDDTYGEQGILINGNVYVPIDLADQLGANLSNSPIVRRIRYRGTVYIKAIELRDFHVSISPGMGRTFHIRSQLALSLDAMERIMGSGHASADQLQNFLEANHAHLPTQLDSLPELYLQEAALEGVNHDLAFVQMCLETQFLKAGGARVIEKFNFANLGDGHTDWAEFATPGLGVRAHIQQLKAYGSTAELTQEVIAPRFGTVRRGVAPTLRQLPGRWSTDPQYALKLLAMLRRFYEFIKLF